MHSSLLQEHIPKFQFIIISTGLEGAHMKPLPLDFTRAIPINFTPTKHKKSESGAITMPLCPCSKVMGRKPTAKIHGKTTPRKDSGGNPPLPYPHTHTLHVHMDMLKLVGPQHTIRKQFKLRPNSSQRALRWVPCSCCCCCRCHGVEHSERELGIKHHGNHCAIGAIT